MSGGRSRGRGRGRKKKEEVEEIDEPTYCICRSADISRFMIGCDNCEEWYHGDCINVTPKQAVIIKKFYCHLCRRKDTSLEIEYKGSKGNKKKPKKRRRVSTRNSSPSDSEPVLKRARSGSNKLTNQRSEDEDIDDEATDDEMETAGVEPDDEDDGEDAVVGEGLDILDVNPDDDQDDDELLLGGAGAEECCGRCEYCRDAKRQGGIPGQRGFPRCRQVQNMHQKPASRMRHDIYGQQRYQQNRQIRMRDNMDNILDDFSSQPQRRGYQDNHVAQKQGRRNSPGGRHNLLGGNQYGGSSIEQISNPGYQRRPSPTGINKRMRGVPHPQQSMRMSAPLDNDAELSDSDEDLVLPDYSHCLGPACMMPARPGNKFCSEECALRQNNSRGGFRTQTGSRYSNTSTNMKDMTPTPYTLPYPDHLYCKHHRYFNWHNSDTNANAGMLVDGGTVPRTMDLLGGTVANQIHSHHHSHQTHYTHNQDPTTMSTAAAMAAMAQGVGGNAAEDYYTINEDENLEINWPQDTVSGGVNG